MTSNYLGPERDYTVLVRCFTFNQSKYIKDALNGFVMQQTTFPFVCLVVDDASTDGEPEVIKSWMERECDIADAKHFDIPTADIIIVPHKANSNCTMAVYFLKENLFKQKEKKMGHVAPWREHCRYEAMCEGDDYWIDPLKLQKQVDYMEQHLSCTLCGTNGLILWDNGVKNPRYFRNTFSTTELKPEDIIGHWCFPTASLLFRKEVFDAIPSWTKKIYSGDQTNILLALSQGTVIALGDITCVYRKDIHNVNSISTIADKDRIYVLNQHELLYSEFDNWTEGRFHAECQLSLDTIGKEIKYIYLKRKSPLYPILLMPQYTLNMFYKKIRKLKEIIQKRRQ